MYIIEIKGLSEKEIIRVMDENHKKASLQESQIKKLEKINNNEEQTKIIIPTLFKASKQNVDNKECIDSEKENHFEDEVNYYLTEISNVKPDEVNQKLKKHYLQEKIIIMKKFY